MEGEYCLGIDWGEARIGLALGHSETKLASPLETVASLDELDAVIAREHIERLVLGQPRALSGQAPVEHAAFDLFVKELRRRSALPLTLIDERLSSKAADRLDPEARRRGRRDAIAAMVILQAYFDSLI